MDYNPKYDGFVEGHEKGFMCATENIIYITTPGKIIQYSFIDPVNMNDDEPLKRRSFHIEMLPYCVEGEHLFDIGRLYHHIHKAVFIRLTGATNEHCNENR